MVSLAQGGFTGCKMYRWHLAADVCTRAAGAIARARALAECDSGGGIAGQNSG